MAWYWVVLECIVSGLIGLFFGIKWIPRKAEGKLVLDLYGSEQPIKLQLYLGIYQLMEREGIWLKIDRSKLLGMNAESVIVDELNSQ